MAPRSLWGVDFITRIYFCGKNRLIDQTSVASRLAVLWKAEETTGGSYPLITLVKLYSVTQGMHCADGREQKRPTEFSDADKCQKSKV